MDKKKTALLLIDLQKEGGTSSVVGMEGIIDRAQQLISACRHREIPIIYTRHISRADGIGLANKEPVNLQGEPIYYHSHTDSIEIIDEIGPHENDIIIDKYRYSGFHGSNLDLMLKSLDIKHLLVGGVLTDCCVFATVLDAYYRDYQVNLVKDLCGTTTLGAHMSATLMMANWVYDLKIYDADQMVKMLRNEKHRVWEAQAPDQLQFSPDNLMEIYSKLK
ncbi:isochorismatase family cysteine hydrolase [Peribacillus sp. SI8-4]|uniref:cysteine hydrolase family protein n=1 Tax=Peribacillus sp. SI8-4 TaxID=3048009 RepID=UPI0025547647|nr:isochorismatase family cysteine hydrolase [Peribacillus sp. SI8-4]